MSQNCWEFFDCDKKDTCPAYPHNGKLCWSVGGTLCRNEVQGDYPEKIGACRNGCDYYRGLMN
ncbi:MAG: two-CW domain-containing protein [Thermodesulfobacteriota bacterium]